jgi:hypothetical protein
VVLKMIARNSPSARAEVPAPVAPLPATAPTLAPLPVAPPPLQQLPVLLLPPPLHPLPQLRLLLPPPPVPRRAGSAVDEDEAASLRGNSPCRGRQKSKHGVRRRVLRW